MRRLIVCTYFTCLRMWMHFMEISGASLSREQILDSAIQRKEQLNEWFDLNLNLFAISNSTKPNASTPHFAVPAELKRWTKRSINGNKQADQVKQDGWEHRRCQSGRRSALVLDKCTGSLPLLLDLWLLLCEPVTRLDHTGALHQWGHCHAFTLPSTPCCRTCVEVQRRP